MSKRRSYSEKLKDPRWQKLRLKILERAGWSCERCGLKDRMLAVHHTYYQRGAEPWDYEDFSLFALCPKCHDLAERDRSWLYFDIAQLHPRDLLRLRELVTPFVERHRPDRATLLLDEEGLPA